MTYGDGTRCVHGGAPEPGPGAPLGPQPVLAAPYHLGGEDHYGRASNPTWRGLEAAVGGLDGGHCVVLPSGMAAIGTVLRVLLQPGDAVVLPSDGYYATRRFVERELPWAESREVPTAGPWPEDVLGGARLVLVETPSNPGLDVCDVAALAPRVHAAGALLAVDNTTATPLGQRPLELGADLVLASDTKALSGHSDVLLGHVSTRDEALAERVREARTLSGSIPGPFETWLAHRGLATLDLRLSRQAANAEALARALSEHPAVRAVRWPGLPGDPSHAVASRQMRRWSGVLGFELADADTADALVRHSALLAAATSFGGVHTTVDRRAVFGDPVAPGYLRLSAGCEDTEDLVADVLNAVNAASGMRDGGHSEG